MPIMADIVADSISPAGSRLTTFVCTFPRIILAEVNTHRALSRNSASSRAMPVEKVIQRVEDDPFIPQVWTSAQRGMQGGPPLTGEAAERAREEWTDARDTAVHHARRLLGLGLHKQVANRLLEPFLFHTAIISATEWGNFFALRDSDAAEPHFRLLARAMLVALQASAPRPLSAGEWHIPFADRWLLELPRAQRLAVATARCARISFMTYDGKYSPEEDVRLHDQLRDAGHWSPFEHCAYALDAATQSGNYVGWCQYRKLFADENRQHPAIPVLARAA